MCVPATITLSDVVHKEDKPLYWLSNLEMERRIQIFGLNEGQRYFSACLIECYNLE
jgi:hypothetical protein